MLDSIMVWNWNTIFLGAIAFFMVVQVFVSLINLFDMNAQADRLLRRMCEVIENQTKGFLDLNNLYLCRMTCLI